MKELLARQEQKERALYECFALSETGRAEYPKVKGAAAQSGSAIAAQIAEWNARPEDTGADGRIRNRFVSCFQTYRDIEALPSEIADDIMEKSSSIPAAGR